MAAIEAAWELPWASALDIAIAAPAEGVSKVLLADAWARRRWRSRHGGRCRRSRSCRGPKRRARARERGGDRRGLVGRPRLGARPSASARHGGASGEHRFGV